jgi:hypothetical protein
VDLGSSGLKSVVSSPRERNFCAMISGLESERVTMKMVEEVIAYTIFDSSLMHPIQLSSFPFLSKLSVDKEET